MALQPLTAQKQRQRILLGVLAALLIAGAAVYWFALFAEPAQRRSAGASEQRTLEFNFDLFDAAELKNLPEPPTPREEPEDVGRENPFVPF